MSHNHQHAHIETVQPSNRNVFITGIFLNLAFVITELITGFIYNSVALLTDAGHNATDVASLVLSLVAFWMAKKKINFCLYLWF